MATAVPLALAPAPLPLPPLNAASAAASDGVAAEAGGIRSCRHGLPPAAAPLPAPLPLYGGAPAASPPRDHSGSESSAALASTRAERERAPSAAGAGLRRHAGGMRAVVASADAATPAVGRCGRRLRWRDREQNSRAAVQWGAEGCADGVQMVCYVRAPTLAPPLRLKRRDIWPISYTLSSSPASLTSRLKPLRRRRVAISTVLHSENLQ